MTAQLTIDAVGPEPLPELSQWLSSPELAEALVALASKAWRDAERRGYALRVLEPSAGRGNLVRAVLAAHPSARITAIDIDPRWIPDLEAIPGDVTARCVDFRAHVFLEAFDVAVCNVPFDDGEEVEHLEKLLNEARRILAVLPVRSLHGGERYRRVWRRFDPSNPERDWWIRQKTHCVQRPKFGRGGGSDEILLLDLRQAPGPCEVSWW